MTKQKRTRPWFKFYPTDWRADPLLRSCSLAARGLWIELIGLMAEADPYGHLLIEGRAPTTSNLANLVGVSPEKLPKLLRELGENGVYSTTETGVIFSRRMVADFEKTQENQRNGKKGGNPNVKAGLNPPVKAISHMPEARSQSKALEGREEDSKTEGDEASRIIAAFDDTRAAIFGEANRRPWPAANDRVYAERFVAAGWNAESARGVFRASMEIRKAGRKPPPGGLGWFENRFAETAPAAGARMARTTAGGTYVDDDVDRELMRLIAERETRPLAERGPVPRRADAERSLAEATRRGAA